jgi:TonB-linked SusC/RagA family outer membrane protein
MKISCFLFFFGVITLVASPTYAQNTKISLDMQEASVESVLNKIEEVSEFYFLFNHKLIDVERTVDVYAQNEPIKDILGKIFPSDVKFIVSDRQIVLTPEEGSAAMELIIQQKQITGKVTDASKGESMTGVNIQVEGTLTGTITNASGMYSIVVPNENAILVYSFVGYDIQKIPVSGKTTIDVALVSTMTTLDEVVVTAMGIEKAKKTLTYATQQLNMAPLTTIKDVNLGNALAGKVAGVSITASTQTSGVSGDPRIIIRGDRSINNNNQPLIVIDGIPFSSSGSGLSGINTDDVESINILKGPAASALYGSSANNGVIVVTTKKGKVGQSNLEINSVTTFDFPYLYPEFQNEYAHGLGGIFMDNIENYSWGPLMTGQTVTDWTGKETTLDPQPNNVKDLFKTGYNTINSFSYSTGVNKSTAYFSYSNTTARGLLETDKMMRHNLNLRLTSELVKNLTIDFKINYFNQFLEDQPDVVDVGVGQFNVMQQLCLMPRSIRDSDIKEYSYYANDLSLRQHVWIPDNISVCNPYWSMYANEMPSTINRVNTLILLKYNFTDWLYLQLRGGMNVSNTDSERKMWWDTKYIWSGKGDYSTSFSRSKDMTGDVLLVFNKKLTNDFQLGVTLGAEIKDYYGRSMSSAAGGLTVENKFALNYGATPTTSDGESRIQKQALYGMAHLEFKDYLYLDFTARNDWSSTLPPPYNYFYPSVGLTGIISDMFTLPKVISFLKVRGSYAEVGNDASFAQIFQTYSGSANGPVGMLSPSPTKVPVNLIPENTKSWEAGGEIRILENRLGVDFTWYKSNTYNQLVNTTTPPSSGFTNAWINCGNIQNKGIEMIISATPVAINNFKWSLDLNFTRNRNKVIKLSETMTRYEVASATFALGRTWVEVGRPFGEMYTKGLVRNDSTGQIVVDALGMPKIQADFLTYLGNFNYDWRGGLTNYISYKNWNISFLIDLNYGGVRPSGTEANMLKAGTSKASLEGREEGIIIEGVKEDGTPNDIQITAQAYYMLIGGRIDVASGESFNHDATNSRLREFSLGYSVPIKSNLVSGLQLSLIGRNLFYIYNGCKWFDPDNTSNTNINGQGAENGFLPGTRTFGISIKLTL